MGPRADGTHSLGPCLACPVGSSPLLSLGRRGPALPVLFTAVSLLLTGLAVSVLFVKKNK